ncbi:MAG TPA: F0F1 ATP synthase subunit A [Candidatus Saccharimonadaceae bacterium]|nr:F0F1 ATP synthase subunit A [Candidatus Saccharimonadaceae bacterium]
MFNSFAESIEISVPAQAIFHVAGFPITNSLITGIVGVAAMFAVFGYVVYMVKHGRYNRFVGLVQWCFEGMFGQVLEVIPDKKMARVVAPYALTIFFAMLASYWMSILPGLDSVKIHGAPLLRSLAADLNFPLVVALIVFALVQILAIQTHGHVGNLKRYLKNPVKDPLGSFEGILEIIGEVSRYSALAVRMFGNCFAGEILLVIIAVLTQYISIVMLPPFLLFEMFIGFVQAYVFFILTIMFVSLAVDTSAHSSDHSPAHAKRSASKNAV